MEEERKMEKVIRVERIILNGLCFGGEKGSGLVDLTD